MAGEVEHSEGDHLRRLTWGACASLPDNETAIPSSKSVLTGGSARVRCILSLLGLGIPPPRSGRGIHWEARAHGYAGRSVPPHLGWAQLTSRDRALAPLLIESNKARQQPLPQKCDQPCGTRPKLRPNRGVSAKELGSRTNRRRPHAQRDPDQRPRWNSLRVRHFGARGRNPTCKPVAAKAPPLNRQQHAMTINHSNETLP
jgi:hypothetical protein